ncbi:MBL fold metallo-hydrolase [Yunchengibacter salinarum]|uniref:MBL fold metallo-hydrolase n=1 Tax=Yunchengibacter salinarum TaxID=3133399 RepID=UPI0035B5E1C3
MSGFGKFAAVCALVMGAGAPVFAQNDMADVTVTREALRGPVHVIFGRGGNIALSSGSDGAFLVDDQYAPLTDKIRAAVAETGDPVLRFVINTHFHMDHSGGNENLGQSGALIIAHDNVRHRLKTGAEIKAFGAVMDPASDATLPVVTFNEEMSLHLNGEEARVIHVPHAHTDGDSMVHFTGSNVLHMGDTFFNNRFPFIDVDNGGSIDGILNAVSVALERVDDDTIIIPGHGPVTDRAGLETYRDVVTEARDRIAAQKAEGKSLKEIQAAAPLADMADKWHTERDGWTDLFISFVYRSLPEK